MVSGVYLFKDYLFAVIGEHYIEAYYPDGKRYSKGVYDLVCLLRYKDYTDSNDIIFPAGTLLSFDATLIRDYPLMIGMLDFRATLKKNRAGTIGKKYMPFFQTSVLPGWEFKPYPKGREDLFYKLSHIAREYFSC